MKLCASRAFWLTAYPSQGHEMLFDAHARGFAALGIARRGVYDFVPGNKIVVLWRTAFCGLGRHKPRGRWGSADGRPHKFQSDRSQFSRS